jgi:hypothetical protein
MADPIEKERPILFSAPMVRAILAGTKTQTRRAMKHPLAKAAVRINSYKGQTEFDCILPDETGGIIHCPYGAPGDRLWVRETWAVQHEYDAAAPSEIGARARWHYAATEDLGGLRKRPSIFLPRRGSRILLEIADMRVQRLHEISDADALAEGVSGPFDELFTPRFRFEKLWESINGPCSWDLNPWVWVIEFRRLPAP